MSARARQLFRLNRLWKSQSRRIAYGFTLLEILVVVAIISILNP